MASDDRLEQVFLDQFLGRGAKAREPDLTLKNRFVDHLNNFEQGSTIQLFGDPEEYTVTGETEGHMVELKRNNGSTVYIPGMEEAVLVCVRNQKPSVAS